MEVVFERMVIPLSLSCGFESIALSATASLFLKVPDAVRSALTKVVFPWSTCAMIAMFLLFIIKASPCFDVVKSSLSNPYRQEKIDFFP